MYSWVVLFVDFVAEAVKMLITGPPGCGKSALTANWICEQKNKKPQDISVYYYVGCTRESCGELTTNLYLYVEW